MIEAAQRTRPRRIWMAVLGMMLCAVWLGCTNRVPQLDSPNRGPDGFHSRYASTDKSLSELWRWQWMRHRQHLPSAPQYLTPQQPPDMGFIGRNAVAGKRMQPAVTWIGHASALVQMGGLNVLTDPVFSERASPVSFAGPRRAQPPGVLLDQLPHIDAVVISHNHYDHLDKASVKALARQRDGAPIFLVPLGLKAWFEDQGITTVQELDWWEATTLGGVDFVLTPVQHWSARSPFDRRETLWGGWAIFAADFQLYFGGDTGYSRDFIDTARHFADRQQDAGFDLALLPIGAYEPRWFMRSQHCDPDEAVQIHRDLRARRSMAIHWGVFELADDALDAAPQALATARRRHGVLDDEFIVPAIGQTLTFPRRAEVPAQPLLPQQATSTPSERVALARQVFTSAP